MRFLVSVYESVTVVRRSVVIDNGGAGFTSFPAEVENPNYDSFLESQSLTDAEVQAMEPDVWHDMA